MVEGVTVVQRAHRRDGHGIGVRATRVNAAPAGAAGIARLLAVGAGQRAQGTGQYIADPVAVAIDHQIALDVEGVSIDVAAGQIGGGLGHDRVGRAVHLQERLHQAAGVDAHAKPQRCEAEHRVVQRIAGVGPEDHRVIALFQSHAVFLAPYTGGASAVAE